MKNENNFFITNTLTIKSTNKSQITKYGKNTISTYKKNQKEEKELINNNFLDYLINNQANFANFEKVIEYYEEKIRNNKNIYNENLKKIEHKKEEIQNLKKTIYNNILNNYTITNKYMNEYYKNIIDKIKNDIILKEHELEIFKKLYNDIYKQNYRLNSKLETENKLFKISNEQHEKYLYIKDISLSKLMKQEEMLKTLNYYFNKCQETNKDLLSQKMVTIKKLNYELYMLKNDEKKFIQNIDEIKDKINKINIIIADKKKIYINIVNDYKSVKKNFLKDDIYMNQIYEILGVMNVDHILNKFKKLRQKYNELSLNSTFKSKEIISLNGELTDLNKTYNNILENIKDKKLLEENDNKKIKYNDKFENFTTMIEKSKNILEEKYDVFKDKMEIFNKCIHLILRIIDNIFNSTTHSKDYFTQYNDINKNRNLLIQSYQEYFYDIQHNKNNFYKEIVNKKFLKFIIFILNELNYRIKNITSDIHSFIYKKEKKFESKKNLGENNSDNSDIELNTNNNLYIFPFNTKKFKNIYINELKIQKEKIEEKKKFYEGTDKNCIKSNNSIDKNDPYYLPSIDRDILPRNRSMDSISTKDFLYNYYLHYKKTILNNKMKYRNVGGSTNSFSINKKNNFNNEFNTSSNFFNSSTKTKYNDSDNNKINLNKFNFVINFTNDFVSDKKEQEAKKQEKYEKIFKKSKIIKEKLEKEELYKYLKKRRKDKQLSMKYHSQDDISLETSEKDESEAKQEIENQMIHQELIELKKPKKYSLIYENDEIGKIFERYDDIRTLELNFFKNKKNYMLDSSFFNEYYFKLKNQFHENRIKANLRNKILKHSKDLFYKTINQTNKFKIKKDNNNNNTNIQKESKNTTKNNKFYETMRSLNKTKFHKNYSYITITNKKNEGYFNKSNTFRNYINKNKTKNK